MKYLRLKKAKQITAVLRNGKRLRAETLTVVLLPEKETAMAVCVGKKFGKSVVRNRVKRLLREAFRTVDELPSAHVLLIPRVAETYSFAAFSADLKRLFAKEMRIEHQDP